MTDELRQLVNDAIAEFDMHFGPFFYGPQTQEALKQLRHEHHEMRLLLETAVDAHESGGKVAEEWYERAKNIIAD